MSVDRIELAKGDVVVLRWAGPAGTEDMARAALVVDDHDEVEVFEAAKIAPIGLTSYLAEGHGIAAADLKSDGDMLDALQGMIIVLTARAFSGGAGTLELAPPMSFVARFREAEASVGAPLPIDTESAKGTLAGAPAKPAKSDARIGGMVAMAVLAFLAVFVFVFVWAAG